jgi:threonine synthase
MSRCLGYFVQNNTKEVTVLVATSGDTGGAVASGFYDIEGINVVILYPSGKVSSVQELQLTTLGKNIKAIEIDGNFDDCQQLVKQAFADEELNKQKFLTSANSINVARWLPQQFYYFYAYQQWADKNNSPVICVPSGNFGNICAGLVAHLSGLPVKQFVAAVNANESVHQYLQTGNYKQANAIATLSNAMDVGNPSNFIRILELFKHEYPEIKNSISSFSISNEETKTTIKNIYNDTNYLLDPHGAVAYAALKKYLHSHADEKGIILETAHPVKFYDVVEPIIGKSVNTPEAIKRLLGLKKESVTMKAHYDLFKEYLCTA